MKQAYKIIAGLLLSGIVLVSLLAIMTETSLLPGLGQQMDVSSADYSGYVDVSQTKVICERNLPEIIRRDSKVWNVGEEILIADMFEGKDADGEQTEVEVLDIRDENGNSRMENYQRAGKRAVFSERGAYILELQTMDKERKTAVKKYLLLVDSR